MSSSKLRNKTDNSAAFLSMVKVCLSLDTRVTVLISDRFLLEAKKSEFNRCLNMGRVHVQSVLLIIYNTAYFPIYIAMYWHVYMAMSWHG